MLIATQHVPTTSFPQLISPPHFIGPSPPQLSITGAQSSLPSVHPFIDPTVLSPLAPRIDPTEIMTLSLPNSTASNVQQQRLLLLPPPIAHRSKPVQVVDTCLTSSIRERLAARVQSEIFDPFINTQSSSSAPQSSPSPPQHSTPLNPSSTNFEAHADRTVTSSIENDDRNSFANALAKNLNTAFAGAPPGNNSLPHTVNPLHLTLLSGALDPLHDFPNLDFDPNTNDPVDIGFDSKSSSDTSSDSDSSSDNTERDYDEPDGARIAANAQGEGDWPATHSQSDFMEIDSDGPDVPRPTAKHPDDGRSDERFAGNDSDPNEEFSSSCDDSDEGPSHKTPKTFTPSNGDDFDPKKRTRSSGAGGPSVSTKRRRSPSPVFPRGLGSAENPIDVDQIASLFEPIVMREYVWVLILQFAYAENTSQVKKEEISLPVEANPPIKGNRSYTVFDVTGQPKSFTPSFHVSCKKFDVFLLLIFVCQVQSLSRTISSIF